MKLKSYIYKLSFGIACICAMGSCADMLEPESVYKIYETDEGHLNNQADQATSLVGIIYKMAAIGDRTNLLGEVRGDLVSLTSAAHSDLQDLANFNIGDDNRYNNPRDYYAIINNCNYYLARADENIKDVAGHSIFGEEIAQVRAIRAWTYLQLAMIYGKVPFTDQPLLTEQDADEVSLDLPDRKGIKEICDYFINDLTPYVMVDFPTLYTVASINMGQCCFPVYVVLGDLYLWRASLTGNTNDYREAARCYFNWIVDTRNINGATKSAYKVSPASRIYWEMNTSSMGNSFYANGGMSWQNITIIPMDSAAAQGYFSEVHTLYNNNHGESCSDLNVSSPDPVSITPSNAMRSLSMSQSYYFLDDNGKHADVVLSQNQEDYTGDLRQAVWCQQNTTNTSTGGQSGTLLLQNMCRQDNYNITVYRAMDVWLRFAEAMNGAGFPRAAYAVLATGLDPDVFNDSIAPYCVNQSELDFINSLSQNTAFLNAQYKTRNGYLEYTDPSNPDNGNTMGIHARGSGFCEYDPLYAYPMQDTAVVAYRKMQTDSIEKYVANIGNIQWPEDTEEEDKLALATEMGKKAALIAWGKLEENRSQEQCRVDSMILNEMALECCFDGKRFYDLMRFAKRYNDNGYVADPVSRRSGAENAAIKATLMDENNWYLSWRGLIGVK